MKMLKFCFFTFSFLVFSLVATAQKYEISLAKSKTAKPIQNIVISEIIDLRYDKTNIGWIQKGLSTEKIQADFKSMIDLELRTFLKNNTVPAAASIPLILKVNKLEISESWNSSFEFAAAEVALEFLIKKNDGNGYCSLLNTGSFREPYSTSDLTGFHDENLAAVLGDCFSQVSKLNVTEICSKAKVYPEEYLKVNTYYNADNKSIAMLQASIPKKGVYQNFQEFQNNTPSLDQEVKMDKYGKFIYTKTGKKVENVWGFSDGKHAYILHSDDKNYYPLTKQPDQFVYNGSVTIYNNGAVLVGQILGAAAGGSSAGGGVIAGALSQKKDTAQFAINMVTGRISLVQKPEKVADLTSKGKVVLFRNAKNEAPVPLSIYADDSLIAVFSPNSISEFEFKVPVPAINFCLKANEQTCQQITPNADQIIYFECSQPNKSGAKPVFKLATSKETAYYEKIIRYNQSKSAK